MFLLPKLDGLSDSFPDDVKRTREFLLDRGIPAGSLEALKHFSARLAIDPSFQRDLTSLLQVVIRREDGAVDYLDLLGILFAAAAGTGPLKANDEQEESVREILRFLTQIRRPTGPVGPVFVGSENVVPPAIAAEPPPADDRGALFVRGSHAVAARPISSVPFPGMEESEPSGRRGAVVWIACGTALAVALGSAWALYEKGHATPQTTAALRANPSSSLPPREKEELDATPAKSVRNRQTPLLRRPAPALARHVDGTPAPPAESPIAAQAAPDRPLRSMGTDKMLSPVTSASSAKPSAAATADPATRPLNAMPKSAPMSPPRVDMATAGTPSGRRQLPKWVPINPDPIRRRGGASASLYPSAPGVVHPASVGMMASNLISSPAPAYPAAASQARVQGEVTVRAVVDREGNVIDARVVSGPELLRDVSLEAVQHWRYRPYVQGGKPIEVATTAVLDFELP